LIINRKPHISDFDYYRNQQPCRVLLHKLCIFRNPPRKSKKQTHNQRQNCSPGILLSGGIGFMRYICGAPVLLRGGLKRQWGSPETRFFVVSHPCLGIVRVKANIIVQCLSTTSQCVTLNDPSCHFLLKSVAAPV